MSDFAARIRAARAFAGMTQEQLAERLGTAAQTIKRRESGEQQPKRGELLAIAAICEVPVSFMEHGFGDADRDELLIRLDRIEAALLGTDVDDSGLDGIRDYVRAQITAAAQAAGADGGESAAPTPRRARGPRRAAQ